MNESEWLTCNDPQKKLDFVKDLATLRQLRLFLCAHIRMAPSSPTQAFRSQLADVLERLADSLPGREEALTAMIQEMNGAQWSCIERQDFGRAAYLRECFGLLKLARRPDTGMGLVAREFGGDSIRPPSPLSQAGEQGAPRGRRPIESPPGI